MPIPRDRIYAAQALQYQAAHDSADQVRLIAGPGAGKSSAIEERVCSLLCHGTPAEEIFAISFTRASTRDLRERIHRHCANNGRPDGVNVQVSTLHSLALRILRKAGLLAGRYPADPLVLDNWELENIFDAEFGQVPDAGDKRRRAAVRVYHEAFWSTGVYMPPMYLPPNPPISREESARFLTFHGPRTQAYSCVLPGEIVRQCVDEIDAGNLDPVGLLNIAKLIVDEFQDLNPMDLEFIYALVDAGVKIFIAGDDDQSIYSFRFAQPAGIQDFPSRYPNTSSHVLNDCFRCMPEILGAATSLIAAYPSPNRIAKNFESLYRHCAPNARGIVHRWRFSSGSVEARSLAHSCRDLIAAGTSPRDILVLLPNKNMLGRKIAEELEVVGVPFEPLRAEGFAETNAGRLVDAMLRIVCKNDDYVAHRTILGLRNGVGTSTCFRICEAVIGAALNFRDIFYQPLPNGVFDARCRTAINHARAMCSQLAQWLETDTLAQRLNAITAIIAGALGPDEAQLWQEFAATVPTDIQISELADFISAENDEQAALVLTAVYERLNQPVPSAQACPPRVRLMTMHGAKGLSARVVFIPGLEDDVIPGEWRKPFPGLVLEAARMLYVSITRARATCIASYATQRIVNGKMQWHVPSRFANRLNGAFVQRLAGLSPAETQAIVAECAQI